MRACPVFHASRTSPFEVVLESGRTWSFPGGRGIGGSGVVMTLKMTLCTLGQVRKLTTMRRLVESASVAIFVALLAI